MRDEIDWTDVEAAAKALAGNWRTFHCFAWSRGYGLEDSHQWFIWYTSSRDAGLLEQSNEQAINKRLQRFGEADDADLVFERHAHWAVGYIDGFSIRVHRSDGSITDAFKEFCAIKEALESYPILDEADYSDREYVAALENYTAEMWQMKGELPDTWQEQVYAWFSENSLDRYTENTDDRGAWAPKEKIIEALQALGLLPSLVVENERNKK